MSQRNLISTECLEKARRSVQRGHATHFEDPDKKIKELGVVREWLHSIESGGEAAYLNPIPAPSDPPDYVVFDREGRLVAVEVTEFVDEEAIRQNLHGDKVSQPRTPVEEVEQVEEVEEIKVITKINGIIQKKDGKVFKGGPYAKKILLIFTDEPTLVSRRFEYAEFLPKRSFGPVKQVDEVYFLFSYVGHAYPDSQQDNPLYDVKLDKGYPYIKLSLKKAAVFDKGNAMKETYTAVVKQSGSWWIGWIEEVPGVNCQERTKTELLNTLKITLQEALTENYPLRRD